MMNQSSGSNVDLATLRRAIEQGEEVTLVGFYTDDAEMSIVDNTRPPSNPTTLTGKSAIAGYYHDLCGRAMTHSVEEALASDGGLAFTERCRYANGAQVFSANLLSLRDGKIQHHTLVQAWDA
jgi:hypothetical protein